MFLNLVSRFYCNQNGFRPFKMVKRKILLKDMNFVLKAVSW